MATMVGPYRQRARTVSLNCFMGVEADMPGVACYRHLADVTKPSPAEAFVFIDERPDTINDATFGMQWDFVENRPAAWTLRDKPTTAHSGGGNIAYADGHVETHRWLDSRTQNAPRHDAVMNGNQDILWLQNHGTWRK